jgi:hypothetical protein
MYSPGKLKEECNDRVGNENAGVCKSRLNMEHVQVMAVGFTNPGNAVVLPVLRSLLAGWYSRRGRLFYRTIPSSQNLAPSNKSGNGVAKALNGVIVRGVSVSLWTVYREGPWLAVVAWACTLLWNYLCSHPKISLTTTISNITRCSIIIFPWNTSPPLSCAFPSESFRYYSRSKFLSCSFVSYNGWLRGIHDASHDFETFPFNRKRGYAMNHEKYRWGEYRESYCQFLIFITLAKFLKSPTSAMEFSNDIQRSLDTEDPRAVFILK